MNPLFASAVAVVLDASKVTERSLCHWQQALLRLGDHREIILVVPRSLQQDVVDRMRSYAPSSTANVQIVSVPTTVSHARGAWLGLERCLGDVALVTLNLAIHPADAAALGQKIEAGADYAFCQRFSTSASPYALPQVFAASRRGIDRILEVDDTALLVLAILEAPKSYRIERIVSDHPSALGLLDQGKGCVAHTYRLVEKRLLAALLMLYAACQGGLSAMPFTAYAGLAPRHSSALFAAQSACFFLIVATLMLSRDRITLWAGRTSGAVKTTATYINPQASGRHLNIEESTVQPRANRHPVPAERPPAPILRP